MANAAAEPAPVADEAAIAKWREDMAAAVGNLLLCAGKHERTPSSMSKQLLDEAWGFAFAQYDRAQSLMRAAPRNDDGETAWLIEWPAANGQPARWWRGQCSNWGTADQAIRFCRKQDAEAGIATLNLVRFHGADVDLVATEHSWIGTSRDRASDAGLLQKLREWIVGREECSSHDALNKIKQLLAESPAGDAGESDAELSKWKTIADTKERVAAGRLHEINALRARLQAVEAERDELRKLNTARVASVEKLQASYGDAMRQLVEAESQRDAAQEERDEKYDELTDVRAERDKLAADLAAAKKERDAIEQRETKGVALFDQIVAELRRDLAAAKAEGARVLGAVAEFTTAWLVEYRSEKSPPMWWTGVRPDAPCLPPWGTANQAIRFARREDAEAFIARTLTTELAARCVATEHAWPALEAR